MGNPEIRIPNEGPSFIFAETHQPGASGVFFRVPRVLFSKRSKYQQIDVFETTDYGRMLAIDGMVMTAEKDEFIYHEMLVHPAMFVHPEPKKVLVVGGGDGGTVREVLKHRVVEKVDMVEIDEVVIEASKKFLPTIASAFDDPRLTVFIADGVDFIKDKKNEYDVIFIDSSDPVGPATVLFSEEFYRSVHNALKDGGIMVAQSESPYINIDIVPLIFKNIKSQFKIAKLYFTTVPTYPPFWAYIFASDEYDPVADFDPSRVSESGIKFKCYNAEYHSASFVLPTFIKESLEK